MQDERPVFHGRTHGKTLRPAQRAVLERDLGRLSLPGVGRGLVAPLDLGFAGGRPIWLEIGFGGGEHLIHMAGLHPGVQFIGVEPFVNGIAMFLRRLEAAGLGNIRLHPGDVRDVFAVLPQGSVSKVFLNYPDPWPKLRHHKRRFVTPGYLAGLARVTASGAEFRVATDIPDYVRQTLEEVPKAGFDLVAGPSGEPWVDWTRTRYEAKAVREGRGPNYLTFRRKD
jgi:tRNA (guanine-N7-)-methyltransferase